MEHIGKSNNKFEDLLKNPNKQTFFIIEFTPEEIMDQTKKSADIYGISPKLIKTAAEVILSHLSLIFNCSIEQRSFTKYLRLTVVFM